MTVRCGCCGRVVVVGTEGRAGNVGCSSLLPRVVLGEVVAVTATTHPVANLDVEDVVLPAAAVVASAAGSCLDEAGSDENVELPDAKARAARCRCSTWLC